MCLLETFVYALVDGRRTITAWLLLATGVTEARGLADQTGFLVGVFAERETEHSVIEGVDVVDVDTAAREHNHIA